VDDESPLLRHSCWAMQWAQQPRQFSVHRVRVKVVSVCRTCVCVVCVVCGSGTLHICFVLLIEKFVEHVTFGTSWWISGLCGAPKVRCCGNSHSHTHAICIAVSPITLVRARTRKPTRAHTRFARTHNPHCRIDVKYRPRMTWALGHTDRAQAQTAYEVVVAKFTPTGCTYACTHGPLHV
jgi:hypothetical protein